MRFFWGGCDKICWSVGKVLHACALLTRYHFLKCSWNPSLTYFMSILSWACRSLCMGQTFVSLFPQTNVSELFASFSAHFPALPDVSFPHHWLLNENLLRFLQCTHVSALVSEWLCASVCLCSRSHPSCSVACLIGGILVSLESECVYFVTGNVLCGMCLLCVCVCDSVADPTTCQPSV